MKNALALLILLLIGSGCQKTTIREVPMPGAPQQQMTTEGAVDSGGENGINGRTLESYSFALDQLPEYKSFIEPLIAKLAKTNVGFAAAMYHIVNQRSWYLVPVPLSKIPASKIGVSFENEQFALQTQGEVWIYDKVFDKMSDDQRKTLLVHEILMGLRIYRFTSKLDRCLARSAEAVFKYENSKAYANAQRVCLRRAGGPLPVGGGSGTTPWTLGQKLDLNNDDYARIRNLTRRIIKSQEAEISTEELDVWMAEAGLNDPTLIADPEPVPEG